MKIIVCVDSKGGMLFNGRRQSQDRLLRQKIAEICNGAPLFINDYSAKMFDGELNTTVSNDFLTIANNDDFCFVENVDFGFENVSEVYVFNWNRKYPADRFFDFDARQLGFKKVSKEEFAGSSHEKITLEVYLRDLSK